MNKIYNPEKSTWQEILKRPTASFSDIEVTAKGIFKEVQVKGDEAVLKYSSLISSFKPLLADFEKVSNHSKTGW